MKRRFGAVPRQLWMFTALVFGLGISTIASAQSGDDADRGLVKEKPASRRGPYIKPSISYNRMTFEGGRIAKAKGFTFGGSAGYDFRVNNLVIGPVFSMNYDLMKSRHRQDGELVNYRSRVDYDGSAGGRVGIIMDRVFLYATGGYAFENLRLKDDVSDYRQSRFLSGYTAGAGVEYVLSSQTAVRVGFNRVQLKKQSYDTQLIGAGRIDARLNKLDIGIVRRF